jgi:hypothetical protein
MDISRKMFLRMEASGLAASLLASWQGAQGFFAPAAIIALTTCLSAHSALPATVQMALPGKFEVSAAGATYTIPLAVPPRTAGTIPI